MSHEHEALYLAVASIDFELDPQEQARMQAGLLDCAECADAVASHQELVRLLGRLPVHEASPDVRERVLRAALVPPRQRHWPVLLAAAALLGLLLAAAFAVGAFRERSPLEGVVVVPSASAPALGDIESTPEPSGPGPSIPGEPRSSVAPGSVATPIAADTLASVVSGRLRVRSQPRIADDSIKYEPLLDVGDQLLVVDGPVVSNDYEWYQVVAWRPGDLYATLPTGWVARGDHDGTAWIRPSANACPTGEITIDVVAAMFPEERVACFGHRSLSFRAWVSGDGESFDCIPEPDVACVDGPAWLTGYGGWGAEAGIYVDTPSIGGPRLALDPDGPVARSAMPSNTMAELEGAFDHPAARDCRAGAVGPDAQPIATPMARLLCRAVFVVTRVRFDAEYPVAGAAGITVTDDLRVRSEPGLTSERYELLPSGMPVWVVEGPALAADYEWFQVIVPGVAAGVGTPRVGWVAASDHGGERWLAKRTVECPDHESPAVRDLMRLTASGLGDGLSCYGSSTIRFTGTIGLLCGGEAVPDWEISPDWLSANAFYRLSIRDGDAVVVAHPRPDLSIPMACGEDGLARYQVEAHFDDDTAAECDVTSRRVPEPTDPYVVAAYWCRTALVVDRLLPAATTTPSAPPQ